MGDAKKIDDRDRDRDRYVEYCILHLVCVFEVRIMDVKYVITLLPLFSFSIGHDLALMSLCNHTIISHGTFSYWAGYFAGGLVVRPEHFSTYR